MSKNKAMSEKQPVSLVSMSTQLTWLVNQNVSSFFLQIFPMWLAPNVMTFVGWVLTVAIFLILSYYDPYIVAGGSRNDLHKHYHIPQWIWIYIALAHFAAHTLDGCDGKQARRTKSRWIYSINLDCSGGTVISRDVCVCCFFL